MAEEKKMIIDGVSCPFTTERNVLEVARNNGIDIPSLCYCENLSIYGGCRLCLVENDRGKMDAACSMQPRDGMVVSTHTKQVLDSRRTTLQLLMSSHRADCLTCDQSGRCKLQEYARRYHVDAHRFEPNTYCTEPMDLSSPSIVRDPSKCILCGLCVRTCAEIQNIGAVDFSGRGKKAHISADFGKTLKDTDCVGCGQCAAVCPTGAITIRNETEKFWSMLQDQTRKVVVQYAPSVRVGMAERFGLPANEPCTGKLVAALRRLGVDVVYDTNLTADLTIMEESAEFLEKVKTGAKLPMFTSCCPGWIQHVEHRHPHLMPQVSTCGSPDGDVRLAHPQAVCGRERLLRGHHALHRQEVRGRAPRAGKGRRAAHRPRHHDERAVRHDRGGRHRLCPPPGRGARRPARRLHRAPALSSA